MTNQSYSGKELELALKQGDLTRSSTTLTGMVKQSDKSDHISFTFSNCDDGWVDIPTEMIKTAKQVGQQSCKDHSHLIMEIELNAPQDPQGEILMALLSQATSRVTHSVMPTGSTTLNNLAANNALSAILSRAGSREAFVGSFLNAGNNLGPSAASNYICEDDVGCACYGLRDCINMVRDFDACNGPLECERLFGKPLCFCPK